MKIELKPVADLKPYPQNPRVNDNAVAAVAASIKEFGWRNAIVVDEQGTVICGHTRLKAAIQLGIDVVPVHTAEGLTEAQVRALRIADNRTHERSDWNFELLPLELGELKALDYDMSILGWDEKEMQRLLSATINTGLTDPDDIPAPPDEPITRRGDMWRLGRNWLLCGDAGSVADMDRLLQGAPVHLVVTDCPYNVSVEPRSNNAIAAGLSSYESTAAVRGHHQKFDAERRDGVVKPTTRKMRAKDRPLANDFVTDEAFDALLDQWFGNIARVLLPGHSFHCWGGYANLANYPPALKRHGLYFSQCIVWDKLHPVLTRKDLMGAYEIAFYGWKEGAAHRYFGPNNATDLWHIKKIPPQQMTHLTAKPVELYSRAIEYSSQPGENVLDSFGGSGPCLIACEQLGRTAYIMELDELYADQIRLRWEQFTGQKAELVSRADGAPSPQKTPVSTGVEAGE